MFCRVLRFPLFLHFSCLSGRAGGLLARVAYLSLMTVPWRMGQRPLAFFGCFGRVLAVAGGEHMLRRFYQNDVREIFRDLEWFPTWTGKTVFKRGSDTRGVCAKGKLGWKVMASISGCLQQCLLLGFNPHRLDCEAQR